MNIKELKIEMLRNNISQKKIALKLKKTEACISNKFKKSRFTVNEAEKISKLLNLSDKRKIEIFFNS